MKILAFDHINIAMPADGEAQARAFYGDVLNLTEIAVPMALAGYPVIWFQSGDVVIHLGVDEDFHPSGRAHPALLVDDLDGFLARCREHGVLLDGTQPPLDGYRREHIFDPFGNRLEIMQRYGAPYTIR